MSLQSCGEHWQLDGVFLQSDLFLPWFLAACRFDSEVCSHLLTVPILILMCSRNMPHQPRKQSRGLLDPTLDLRGDHGHYSVQYLRLLYQSLPRVSGRLQHHDQQLWLAFIQQQRADCNSSSSTSQSSKSCPASVERNRHCPYHYHRCHLFFRCICPHGQFSTQCGD